MSDDTIQQVYMRITGKIQDGQKQLSQIEAQLNAHQREIRLAALTQRELEGLDSTVPLYRSMGKMFIQEKKEDLLKAIAKDTDDSNKMIEALEKKQKFVKRDVDEATNNLRDIVRATSQAAAKGSK
ncbi:Prefoldin [Martensiomyces pterosporus]|nr:Prefoldin [Martensiomyces pterosporus]